MGMLSITPAPVKFVTAGMWRCVYDYAKPTDGTFVGCSLIPLPTSRFGGILAHIRNKDAAARRYFIRVTEQPSLGQYDTEYLRSSGGTLTGGRTNYPVIGEADAGEEVLIDVVVTLDLSGYFRWVSRCSKKRGASVQINLYAGCSRGTFTSTSDIWIEAVGNYPIAAGSRFQWYRRSVVKVGA